MPVTPHPSGVVNLGNKNYVGGVNTLHTDITIIEILKRIPFAQLANIFSESPH
jgi:hypothetical protein